MVKLQERKPFFISVLLSVKNVFFFFCRIFAVWEEQAENYEITLFHKCIIKYKKGVFGT